MVLVLLAWLVVAVTMPAPRYRDRGGNVVELDATDADDGASDMNKDRAGVKHGTRC